MFVEQGVKALLKDCVGTVLDAYEGIELSCRGAGKASTKFLDHCCSGSTSSSTIRLKLNCAVEAPKELPRLLKGDPSNPRAHLISRLVLVQAHPRPPGKPSETKKVHTQTPASGPKTDPGHQKTLVSLVCMPVHRDFVWFQAEAPSDEAVLFRYRDE